MLEIYLDNFQHGDNTLVATVEPSELQGPPGGSLLWSVAHVRVL